MAVSVTAGLACRAAKQALLQCRCIISVQPIRNRYKKIRRGKWPEDAKTFEMRLEGLYKFMNS